MGLDEEDEVGSGSDGSDFGITLNEWDDEAPWAPWASLDDPWESVELDCGWVDAPLRELVDRDYVFFGDEDDDEKELDEYDPRRYGKDMLVPTNAPTWTLRAVPTGAFREDGSGGMAGELSAAAKRFDLGAGIFSERTAFGGSYSNAAVDDGDEHRRQRRRTRRRRPRGDALAPRGVRWAQVAQGRGHRVAAGVG